MYENEFFHKTRSIAVSGTRSSSNLCNKQYIHNQNVITCGNIYYFSQSAQYLRAVQPSQRLTDRSPFFFISESLWYAKNSFAMDLIPISSPTFSHSAQSTPITHASGMKIHPNRDCVTEGTKRLMMYVVGISRVLGNGW